MTLEELTMRLLVSSTFFSFVFLCGSFVWRRAFASSAEGHEGKRLLPVEKIYFWILTAAFIATFSAALAMLLRYSCFALL
jgi:hypothetical protein